VKVAGRQYALVSVMPPSDAEICRQVAEAKALSAPVRSRVFFTVCD